jgi:hypothetical protein
VFAASSRVRRVLIVASLCACIDTDGGSGITGTSHVETYELPAAIPPKLDLLFVIDDTAAMASHQTPLAVLPTQLQLALEYSAVANYHLGVITTDNASLRRAAGIPDPFIVHDNTFSGPMNNYEGSLASALRSLFPSSAASTGSNQPLAMTRSALDNHAGFLRSDAYLGIVTISATDDASLGAVDDYAASLKGVKNDPAKVIVSGVFPTGAARLAGFHAKFPNRSDTQSIDDADYVDALELFTQVYKTSLGYACNKEPADLDPDTPGAQYDCAFVSIDNGVEKRLPQCGTVATRPVPCWEIVIDSGMICIDPAARAHLQTRGYTTSMSAYGDPFHPAIRGQCLVN